MDLFFLLTNFFFFVWIVRNTFFWVWLWQLKEYRLDRILIHLRETGQGKKLLFSPVVLFKYFVILSYVLVALNSSLLPPYQAAIFLIFFYESILIFRERSTGVIKIPVFTFKAIIITSVSFLFVLALFMIPLVEKFLWILLLDRLLPLAVAFLVFLLYFPTEFYRDYKIEKAAKKIASFKNLLVIGVTGSYGKSSTKNYIAKILGEKFNILKTRGTNNTPIGIANTILNELNEKTQVFVVEMGAYKRGEIAQMCRIVKPKIGVITSVNDQHLSLFKNLENTLKAKYELIESLPKAGLALFNGDNDGSYKLFLKCHKNKIVYGTKEFKDVKNSFLATNIIEGKNNISFNVQIKNQNLLLNTSLLGKWNVEDILPAVYIADYLGMKKNKIKEAVSLLQPHTKTMIYKTLDSGTAIVDDSFNANPASVISAIEYMKQYKGDKILVLQPMIELGKNGERDHYNIAKEISKNCDYLFLTNKNFYKPISEGFKDAEGKCILKTDSLKSYSEYIKNKTKKGDVVVFEGKESAFVLDMI